LPANGALERDLDEAGITAVEAAQQMHGIGQIASAMGTGRFQKAVQMRVARATVARDAGKLRLGNADRLRLHQSRTLM
jgi:hypothetical protein